MPSTPRLALAAAVGLCATAVTTTTNASTSHDGASAAEPVPAATTTIQPGTLDRAHRPRVLYRHGRTLVDGKREVRIRGPKRLSLVGKAGGRYVLLRYGRYHGHLWVMRAGKKARRLGIVGDAAYSGGDQYAINAAGRRIAFSALERSGGSYMSILSVPSGRAILDDGFFASTNPIVAFPGKRLVLDKPNGTFWYSPETGEGTRITRRSAVVADPAHNRMVLWGNDSGDRFRLVRFGDPAHELGSWNRGRALTLSPDGERLLTRVSQHTVQVRSTADGQVIHTFRAPRKVAYKPVWESSRRVLLPVRGHKVAAYVRCSLRGECERTTRLAKNLDQLGVDLGR